MFRHGLPLSLALMLLASGCQNPWRVAGNGSDPTRLEHPDSLTDFPTASAEYPDDVDFGDDEKLIALTGGEEIVARPDRRRLESILSQAGALLREATGKQEPARTEMLSRAKRMYGRVLDADTANAVANHRMGVIADIEHDYKAAEDYYQRALKQTPHNPDLLSDLGYSYQLQQRPDHSEMYLRRALDISPNHARAANNLGKLLAERGDYDGAFAMFRRAGDEQHASRAMQWFFPDGKPDGTQSIKATPVAKTEETDASLFDGELQPGELTPENPPAATVPPTGPGSQDHVAARDRVLIADEELRRQFDLLDPRTVSGPPTTPGPDISPTPDTRPPADPPAADPSLNTTGVQPEPRSGGSIGIAAAPTKGNSSVAPVRRLPPAGSVLPYPPGTAPGTPMDADVAKPAPEKPVISAGPVTSQGPGTDRDAPAVTRTPTPSEADESGMGLWPGLKELNNGNEVPGYEPVGRPAVDAVYPTSNKSWGSGDLPVITPRASRSDG